jgi:hypothetical protein
LLVTTRFARLALYRTGAGLGARTGGKQESL